MNHVGHDNEFHNKVLRRCRKTFHRQMDNDNLSIQNSLDAIEHLRQLCNWPLLAERSRRTCLQTAQRNHSCNMVFRPSREIHRLRQIGNHNGRKQNVLDEMFGLMQL